MRLQRDFFGIAIAILGAVTVVLSTNPSDARLDHEGLIRAITQRVFIVYSITYIVGAIILSGLSESEFGRRHVFVDVGLCALFGKKYRTSDLCALTSTLQADLQCFLRKRSQLC